MLIPEPLHASGKFRLWIAHITSEDLLPFLSILFVFGGMYFYHSMFDLCHGQCAIWLKFSLWRIHTAILVTAPFNGAAPIIAQKVRVAGRPRLGFGRGGGSGHGFGRVLQLVCLARSLRCFVCLLGLLLCACFRLFLPLLGFFTLLQLAPCLVRVCAGRGQPLCPWDRGDKVVSSCWWVRACFIHPETLFQTLSQVISRRIRPRLAPRTPFNNNPAGTVGLCRRHVGSH